MGKRKKQDGFKTWYSKHSKRLKLDPNPDDPRHHYDYRAAHKAGVTPPSKPGGHWPSKYKTSGHPRLHLPDKAGNLVNTKTGRVVKKKAVASSPLPSLTAQRRQRAVASRKTAAKKPTPVVKRKVKSTKKRSL